MKVQRCHSIALSALSAATVLLSSSVTASSSTVFGCVNVLLADGYCDPANNKEECEYDGGDCCECTCSSQPYKCGINGFNCMDPSSSCVGDEDDDFTLFGTEGSFPFSECVEEHIGDGDCDMSNNNEECGYDNGDCCECDCVSTAFYTCGDSGFQCIDPSATCVETYIDAGALTAIYTWASAYDRRPGSGSNDIGCGLDGCTPFLARDGITADAESRWSCATKIVRDVDGGKCTLDFTFEEPQDLADIEVAFWKVEERSRSLQVRINGDVIGTFDSSPGSVFNSFGIKEDGVKSVAFEPVGLEGNEWISLLEVRLLVEV